MFAGKSKIYCCSFDVDSMLLNWIIDKYFQNTYGNNILNSIYQPWIAYRTLRQNMMCILFKTNYTGVWLVNYWNYLPTHISKQHDHCNVRHIMVYGEFVEHMNCESDVFIIILAVKPNAYIHLLRTIEKCSSYIQVAASYALTQCKRVFFMPENNWSTEANARLVMAILTNNEQI